MADTVVRAAAVRRSRNINGRLVLCNEAGASVVLCNEAGASVADTVVRAAAAAVRRNRNSMDF